MLLPFSAITLKKADSTAAVLPRQLIFWALHAGLPDLGWRGICPAPFRREQALAYKLASSTLQRMDFIILWVCGCCFTTHPTLFQSETHDRYSSIRAPIPFICNLFVFSLLWWFANCYLSLAGHAEACAGSCGKRLIEHLLSQQSKLRS